MLRLLFIGLFGSQYAHLFHKDLAWKKHHLNLFTIVKFPNDGCITSAGQKGTCYTSSECSKVGGEGGGTCAQGFGVCCVVSVGCGGSTRQNITYLNLDTTNTPRCEFTVCPASIDVCRLRLDFDSFTLAGPLQNTVADVVDLAVKPQHSIVGECLVDTFIVTAAEGPSPPVICGTNTGEHMYTSIQGGCATITVNLGQSIISRSLRVKTTQIPCTDEPLSDCLQWYTGVTGTVKSYNDGGTGTHLTHQQYTTCVRREKGYCSICWSSSQFQLSLQTSDNGETGNKGLAEYDLECGRAFILDPAGAPTYAGFADYLEIPQGRCVGLTDATDSVDRYCGEVLACSRTVAFAATAVPSTICSSVYPFQIRVFTDGFEELSQEGGVPGSSTSTRNPQSGFKLSYEQMPC